MLNKEQFLKVLELGIDCNQYLVLYFLYSDVDISDLNTNIRVSSILQTLKRKNYADENLKITELGKKVINDIYPKKEEVKVVNTNNYWMETYSSIENIIKKYTGKTQIMNPSGKYLKPNYIIFETRITEFIKKFKISPENYPDIRRALELYVKDVCLKKIKYPVALIYFIYNLKNNTIQSELLEWAEKEDTGSNEVEFDSLNL